MTTYRIGWNATTRVATVAEQATAIPGGSVDAGTFTWTPPDDTDGFDNNVTVFHFVQTALYKLSGVQNMQRVQINFVGLIHPTGITVAPTTAAKTVGQTQQLTPTFAPTTVDDKRVTYESLDKTIATVSATGLITAVAAGTVTIRTWTVDPHVGGRHYADCVVTVT